MALGDLHYILFGIVYDSHKILHDSWLKVQFFIGWRKMHVYYYNNYMSEKYVRIFLKHKFLIVNKVQYNLNMISVIFEQKRVILFRSLHPDIPPRNDFTRLRASWWHSAQGLLLFIKLPPKSIFYLLFSCFTINTRWQAAIERESVLSTYVCTLFSCNTRRYHLHSERIVSTRVLRSTHTRVAPDVISHSAHHASCFRSIVLFPGTFFMHFSRTHRLHLVLCACTRFHIRSCMCIAKMCVCKHICICTAVRGNKAHKKRPHFRFFYLLT